MAECDYDFEDALDGYAGCDDNYWDDKWSESEGGCACDVEVDSTTGEEHHYVCDWCASCLEYAHEDAICEEMDAASSVTLEAPDEPDPEPWAAEKEFLHTLLFNRYRAAENMGQRLDLIRELFTWLLGHADFLAAHEGFRRTAAAKSAELRTDPDYGHMLVELLDHFDRLVLRLEAGAG